MSFHLLSAVNGYIWFILYYIKILKYDFSRDVESKIHNTGVQIIQTSNYLKIYQTLLLEKFYDLQIFYFLLKKKVGVK